MQTLILRETPNAFGNITGPNRRIWNGSDGFMYFIEDFATLDYQGWEIWSSRKAKYGTNYTFRKVA